MTTSKAAMLRTRGLSKTYGRHSEGAPVLDGVDLSIEEGSFTCVVGPSGCGKTTMLNIFAGFERATAGTVELKGHPIEGPGPDRVIVFQNASSALFPWLNATQNVGFGLRWTRLRHDRGARAEAIRRSLEVVGLWDHKAKFPGELSGGMQQRLQLARALAMDPEVLLMDEPFGALDALTREMLSRELLRVWRTTEPRKTIVFITHDIDEALRLGTRVIVMSPETHGIVGDFDSSEVDFDDADGISLTTMRTKIRELLGTGAL